jgi:hypothetical protein
MGSLVLAPPGARLIQVDPHRSGFEPLGPARSQAADRSGSIV